MIAYRDLPRPTNWLMVKGYEMGYRLVNEYFLNLNEIWGSEVPLYYPGKYAGTTDLVGLYRGNPAIVDFKQSLKPKKHEWIQDYFHQLAAYALAHDVVHGTTITHGYVLIALQTGGTQEFSTTGAEFERYKTAWLERVDRFLSQASAGLPPASQPPQ
jgi:genome maintenance exonuclease 1